MKSSALVLFAVASLLSLAAFAGPGDPILLSRPVAIQIRKSVVHKAKDVRSLEIANFVRINLEQKCETALPSAYGTPKLQKRVGRDSEISPYEVGPGETNINCELDGAYYICAATCTASGGTVD